MRRDFRLFSVFDDNAREDADGKISLIAERTRDKHSGRSAAGS